MGTRTSGGGFRFVKTSQITSKKALWPTCNDRVITKMQIWVSQMWKTQHTIHDDLFKFEKHPPCVVFLKQWTFVHLLVPLYSCFLLDSSRRQCLIEISKYFNNGRNVVKYFLTRLILRQSPESAGNSLIRAATAATVCHSAATPFLRPFSRQPHQDDFCL